MNGLNQACREIAQWREANGADPNHRDPTVIRSRLMGVVSELGEAYDATRKEKRGELSEELADVCIRLFGLIGFLNIDIERAIALKLEKVGYGL